jgi:hypothetical protein
VWLVGTDMHYRSWQRWGEQMHVFGCWMGLGGVELC